MQFDFRRFSGIAALAYQEGNPYTLQQCLYVFQSYFQTYEDYMGHPHPPIRREQVARIMQEMPWVFQDDRDGCNSDIEPEWYPDLINLHFKTRYRCCDYNINHFFSGRIRELRFHEWEAGYE